MENINELVTALDLKPHPEGGYYKETYRSSGEITQDGLGSSYSGNRNFSTCIYFLLTSENFSAFHRIKQDEIWHFYSGSPIRLHIISASGEYSQRIIGNDILNGETPQCVVYGGDWFAAEVKDKNSFSLVGCTVSPGFSFEDFEMPSKQHLLTLFPHLKTVISQFTHS